MVDFTRAADFPLPESGYSPDGAIDLIIERRIEQIVRFGHTPEKDRQLPRGTLPREAQRYLTHAIEDLHFGGGDPEARKRALRHLAQTGAIIIAAIERLKSEETATGEPI